MAQPTVGSGPTRGRAGVFPQTLPLPPGPAEKWPRSAGALILDVEHPWNWSRVSRERIFQMKLEALAKRKGVEGRDSARPCRF